MQNGNGTEDATCATADELVLPLAVTGVGTLGTTNSIESVTLNITHTWSDDIVVSLQDPSGTVTVLLTDDNGGQADGMMVVFQDGAAELPAAGADGPAITGTYAPMEAIGAFNAGVAADGTWNLLVCDDANGDIGSVDDWSITFVPTPTCVTPTGVLSSDVADTTADFSWNDSPTATLGYEWGVLAPGGDPDVDPFLFSGSTGFGVNVAALTGLTPSTDYAFYVRSNCDTAGFSSWSAEATFTTLATPPVNDNACNAIAIAIGTTTSDAPYTNDGATVEANETGPSCSFVPAASESVWFSFVAPVSGEVLIVTEPVGGGTLGDTQITLFTITDCNDLSTSTEIACDDDDDENLIGDGAGLHANMLATGLTDGETYYFSVDGYNNGVGTFDLSVTDGTLSVDAFETEDSFTYFPNPVDNELNLNAQDTIQNIAIYNMIGQEVLRTAPNAVESTVDMSGFSQGAYFVRVTIGDSTETIRIIKK